LVTAINKLKIDTFLFTASEVKSLPSRKKKMLSIMGDEITMYDKYIIGGFNAPYTMPLR
jgi:hypothetical protein